MPFDILELIQNGAIPIWIGVFLMTINWVVAPLIKLFSRRAANTGRAIVSLAQSDASSNALLAQMIDLHSQGLATDAKQEEIMAAMQELLSRHDDTLKSIKGDTQLIPNLRLEASDSFKHILKNARQQRALVIAIAKRLKITKAEIAAIYNLSHSKEKTPSS